MLIGLIQLLINILIWLIIIDAIISWIPSIDARRPMVQAIRRITEPIYRPIRGILPAQRTGYIDLSPLIAVIVLQFIAYVLLRLFA